MLRTDRYDFSFTTSSLLLNGMGLVAEAIIGNADFDYVSILGNGKTTTGKKYFAEINKRLRNLTSEEMDLLVDGDLSTQKHLSFLAVCKTYGFIKDFTLDVLRNKLLVYDYQITDTDYLSFFRGKMSSHDELEELTDSTQKKIKQVMFKIFEQAGIIDNIRSKKIQPQFLDCKVLESVKRDNPNWLRIFFMSDSDIDQIN
ncbi:Putative inner membrane protein [Kaistella treverensis]|uniref:Putative inner membrane protein n=1 Tax=Kaistella treverensis TaxID=631455 RepID=A0A1I3KZM7_9FLAO|nr:DUF1819 family protein [Kaistella treverensis]SFI77880.1 Putative inner membrane protein [Kaistella treverensis]